MKDIKLFLLFCIGVALCGTGLAILSSPHEKIPVYAYLMIMLGIFALITAGRKI